MKSEHDLRIELCDVGRRLYERDLVGATEGNLSARLPGGSILCTPTGISKGHLSPAELVTVSLDGNHLSGAQEASSELLIHLEIYRQRPDAQAVVHAHPIVATGYAYSGEPIATEASPEGAAILGAVAQVPFATPGTPALAEALRPFVPHHKTFLLENHGAVTLGSTLWDAFYRMETLERLARVLLVARMLGSVKPLPASELAQLQILLASRSR